MNQRFQNEAMTIDRHDASAYGTWDDMEAIQDSLNWKPRPEWKPSLHDQGLKPETVEALEKRDAQRGAGAQL